MIPVRLKLRNFMCYRDNVPPLDFTGIHLACLTGDNGNGKSAIIDAMTWALWGRARSRSADDLVHAGQPEMEVEFDFTAGGQVYRIIRKRSRPKKRTASGQSSLEFQIKNADGFRPITGNTIDQTEAKIREVLHMDYDTFVNSAYLRQGHADEFTRQDPARRKEVLGNILGLDAYDVLETRAKELARSHETDSAQMENIINEIAGELEHKAESAAELETAEAELEAAEKEAGEKEAALNLLRQRKETLERIKTQLGELETGIAGKSGDLKRWEEQAAQHLARIKQYEEIMGRGEKIEADYRRFTGVKKQAEELDRKFRQSIGLEKQKNQLEQRIDKSRNELITEHTVIRRDIANLEGGLDTLPDLKNRLNQGQAQAGKLADMETSLREKEQAVREAQLSLGRLETGIPRLEKEIAELKEKLDLIAGHIADHTEAKCPLCERELTREGLERITAQYKQEKQEKTEILNRSRAELRQAKDGLDALQKEKALLEDRLHEEKANLRSREEVIRQKIKEIDENAEKAAELKNKAADIENRMARMDYAAEEQRVLQAIEVELASLGYDADAHEQARRQLKELEPCERDKNSLDEAARLIEQEKSLAARAEENARALQESLKRDTVKKDILTDELTGLPRVNEELAAAEGAHQSASRRRAQAQEAVGSVRAKLKRLAELEVKKKEYEERMAQAAREESIYRELARAFGKAGIQALIIETALPEIAEEANLLLSRLTDSRMTVKFESQRATKKDTVRETLDITIADELGTRNYEMFSGGEAFRINFAIRIALSRLLARRAGAPLPTLIIDEGFGTQDSAGMEKLKEAINSIQNDFEKILVITHMEDLKDAFPARIDVVKTADGSMITVN